jgi:hypothetical protein
MKRQHPKMIEYSTEFQDSQLKTKIREEQDVATADVDYNILFSLLIKKKCPIFHRVRGEGVELPRYRALDYPSKITFQIKNEISPISWFSTVSNGLIFTDLMMARCHDVT